MSTEQNKKPPRFLMSADFPQPPGKGENGKPFCRYCKQEITAPKRRTFCSDQCVHEYKLRTNGQYLRHQVWKRDQGLCAKCHLTTDDWQADHIVPVAEGGGSCGMQNLRTLCLPCHHQETRALMRRLREARWKERFGHLPFTPNYWEEPTTGEGWIVTQTKQYFLTVLCPCDAEFIWLVSNRLIKCFRCRRTAHQDKMVIEHWEGLND